MKLTFCIALWSVLSVCWTAGQSGQQYDDNGYIMRLVQTALSELLTNQGDHYNATAVFKALGLQPQTVEILRMTVQGLINVVRPLARPVFRLAGMLLVVVQFLKTVLHVPIDRFLPSTGSVTEYLGEMASDLGLGVLVEEMMHYNFVGSHYSATWTTWVESCHSRALCDLGQFLGHAMPLLAPFIGIFGPMLGLSGPVLSDIKSGLQTETSCGDIYLNCPHLTEFLPY